MIESQIYDARFSDAELEQARSYWVPIARYLQRYVLSSGTTVDLGAGYCHFINAIESKRKIAVDINGELLRRRAARNVECLTSDGADLSVIPSGSVNTVFASNVYEHFQSREQVSRSFAEVRRVLAPTGKFVILQPNFSYCYRTYFDFFDHRLIFTHEGMAEGLRSANFRVAAMIKQFLPYTSKSGLPRAPWLVSLYLQVPLIWKVLGGQMLLVAEKNVSTGT